MQETLFAEDLNCQAGVLRIWGIWGRGIWGHLTQPFSLWGFGPGWDGRKTLPTRDSFYFKKRSVPNGLPVPSWRLNRCTVAASAWFHWLRVAGGHALHEEYRSPRRLEWGAMP